MSTLLNKQFDGEPLSGDADSSQSTSLIDSFLAEVRVGRVARTNLWEIRLNPPVAGETGGDLRRLTLRAESVTWPGINLATAQDVNIYGPVRDVVEGVTYADEIAITFLETENHMVRRFFQKWVEMAYDPVSWNLEYYQDYASGSLEIYQLNSNHVATYGVKLWECYPKNYGPVSYSMESRNEVVKLSVNFNFRFWTDINKYGSSNPVESSAAEKAVGRPGGTAVF